MLGKEGNKECIDGLILIALNDSIKEHIAEIEKKEYHHQKWVSIYKSFYSKGVSVRQIIKAALPMLNENIAEEFFHILGESKNQTPIYLLTDYIILEDYRQIINIIPELKPKLYRLIYDKEPYCREEETAVYVPWWDRLEISWDSNKIEKVIHRMLEENKKGVDLSFLTRFFQYSRIKSPIATYVEELYEHNNALSKGLEKLLIHTAATAKARKETEYSLCLALTNAKILRQIFKMAKNSNDKKVLAAVMYLKGFRNLDKDTQQKIVNDKELLIESLEAPLILKERRMYEKNAEIESQDPTKAYKLAPKKLITDEDVIRKVLGAVRYKSLKKATKDVLKQKPELTKNAIKRARNVWSNYCEYNEINVQRALSNLITEYMQEFKNAELSEKEFSDIKRIPKNTLCKQYELGNKDLKKSVFLSPDVAFNSEDGFPREIVMKAFEDFTNHLELSNKEELTEELALKQKTFNLFDDDGFLEIATTSEENINITKRFLISASKKEVYKKYVLIEMLRVFINKTGEADFLIDFLRESPDMAYDFTNYLTKKEFNDIVYRTNNLAF